LAQEFNSAPIICVACERCSRAIMQLSPQIMARPLLQRPSPIGGKSQLMGLPSQWPSPQASPSSPVGKSLLLSPSSPIGKSPLKVLTAHLSPIGKPMVRRNLGILAQLNQSQSQPELPSRPSPSGKPLVRRNVATLAERSPASPDGKQMHFAPRQRGTLADQNKMADPRLQRTPGVPCRIGTSEVEPRARVSFSQPTAHSSARRSLLKPGAVRPGTPLPTSMAFVPRRRVRASDRGNINMLAVLEEVSPSKSSSCNGLDAGRSPRTSSADKRDKENSFFDIAVIEEECEEEDENDSQPALPVKASQVALPVKPCVRKPLLDQVDEEPECLTCADVVRYKMPIDNASAWWSTLTPAQSAIEKEWQGKLTPLQFKVLRMKATEPVNTGPLLNWFAAGVYTCAGCSQPLYRDEHKMPTKCGWPAFKDSVSNALKREQGKKVPEITCSGCGGHLGHVFKSDRYPLPHHERHCVNSASLKFLAATVEVMSEPESP